MKINLAENMLRFGAKNLTEVSKRKLVRLAEQAQTGATTPPADGTEQQTQNTGTALAPLNVKSITPLDKLLGAGFAANLSKMWPTIKDGDTIFVPSANGIISAYSPKGGGTQGSTPLMIESVFKILPQTIVVPANKIGVRQPAPNNSQMTTAAQDLQLTVLTLTEFPLSSGIRIALEKNMSVLDSRWSAKVPELKEVNPDFVSKVTWDVVDGVKSLYPNPDPKSVPPGYLQNHQASLKALSDYISKVYNSSPQDEDASAVLDSPAFIKYARTITPKPGAYELAAAALLQDDELKTVYTEVSKSPEVETPVPAKQSAKQSVKQTIPTKQ